ncbi:protein phosphatase 2C 70-like isoform X2 [Salvia splendens]|uniref:protein phosphatase 2C 70-like isoform X2 n=1 Tax=Salvia splendens TaxID=180675 RepID=UPI001C26F23B|nr:protein phosphatase 2C 70-like isoform X2 [Salvia splendens]
MRPFQAAFSQRVYRNRHEVLLVVRESHLSNTPMEKAMRFTSIFTSSSALPIALLILMLSLVLILIFIACKFRPWTRFLSASTAAARRRAPASIRVDDIERPLVSGDLSSVESDESTLCHPNEQAGRQTQGSYTSSHTSSHTPSASSQLTHENPLVGQTLQHPHATSLFPEDRRNEKRGDNYSQKYSTNIREPILSNTANQGSILKLEVVSGPARGLQYSVKSTNATELPVTIGRVSPGDLILKDSEVSGKHAMINWNANKLKWELVDMGSLNGTMLNSLAVLPAQSGNRHWSNPVELSSGDTVTFGTSSKISVNITSQTECKIPFRIGIASDPMALRRGGKKLAMEDVCYYQWPLHGLDQFGMFGICDGHGGADAATSVSKIMPEVITGILSDSFIREKVLSQCDASEILREAFYQTEARINHYYEGCTATLLLVWSDGHQNFYAQCANVGDSACVANIGGKHIKMTEDHRVTSQSERLRIQAIGTPLRDGESRICGINLARMLGDKFLKEQDARFSAEPYISEVVCIDQSSEGFALLASDGFWDVINMKKAFQLVHQAVEGNAMERESSAEKIAKYLLSEARTLRTKDNTSIIFLDFTNSSSHGGSCKADS